jgi:hypothetical protein
VLAGVHLDFRETGKVFALTQQGHVAFTHASPSNWVKIERFSVTHHGSALISHQLHGLGFNNGVIHPQHSTPATSWGMMARAASRVAPMAQGKAPALVPGDAQGCRLESP